MMKKRSGAIIKLLSAAAVWAVLLAGCTPADSSNDLELIQGSQQLQEDGENSAGNGQDNPAGSDTGQQTGVNNRSPDKEEILKDMMNIPMVDFEAVDLQGNIVKLSDYKGKIILLNFWATWCPPCKEEMPMMEQVYKEFKDQDVIILAVSPTSVELRGGSDSHKAESQIKKFIAENGYTFPVLLDKEDKAWAVYQQRGIPANYIIDKKGVVRYGFAGAFQSIEQMKGLIGNVRAIE